MSALGTVLYEHRKRRGEVFRVAVREHKGTTFVDFRIWAESAEGEPVATAKGATLPLDALEAAWRGIGGYPGLSGAGEPPTGF